MYVRTYVHSALSHSLSLFLLCLCLCLSLSLSLYISLRPARYSSLLCLLLHWLSLALSLSISPPLSPSLSISAMSLSTLCYRNLVLETCGTLDPHTTCPPHRLPPKPKPSLCDPGSLALPRPLHPGSSQALVMASVLVSSEYRLP